MAHSIAELRSLLSRQPRSSARVVSSGPEGVLVSTSTGVKRVVNGTAAALKPNDYVTISDGSIVSVRRRDSDLPVFVV